MRGNDEGIKTLENWFAWIVRLHGSQMVRISCGSAAHGCVGVRFPSPPPPPISKSALKSACFIDRRITHLKTNER